MEQKPVSTMHDKAPAEQAVQHVAEAHEALTKLRHAVPDFTHREALDEALRKLEAALNVLTVKTGGLL